MEYSAQPTDRSPGLLSSFPQEILQSILNELLLDVLHTDKSIKQRLSCRVLPFSQLIRKTKNIRGVCSSWTNATRSLVFPGKSTRDGLVLELPCLLSKEDLWTFPMLRNCMVELCHPYSLRELDDLQQDLAKSSVDSLKYVCAVTWKSDDMTDMEWDWVGYKPYGQTMVDTFTNKCMATGLKIADCTGHRLNGGSSADTEQLEEAVIRAMKNFLFKETLALWYYNAHLVLQILTAFPLLDYLVLPEFLNLPLLTRVEYFFPQCADPDDESSPFGPLDVSHPETVQTLEIAHGETGRRYSDIMASVKLVHSCSSYHNPIFPLFSRRPFVLATHRLSPLATGLKLLLRSNCWAIGTYSKFTTDLPERLTNHVDKAISDIPDRKKPKKPMRFRVGHLRNVMRGRRRSVFETPCC